MVLIHIISYHTRSENTLSAVNSMLVHGYNDSMLVGTMVPIPKDTRQLAYTSENFRAIALSSSSPLLIAHNIMLWWRQSVIIMLTVVMCLHSC